MVPASCRPVTPHDLSRCRDRLVLGSIAASTTATIQPRPDDRDAVPAVEGGLSSVIGLEPTDPTVPLPNGITPLMRDRARQIRMLPAVAMQALEVAKCRDCTIDEFASLIVRDVKLTVDMLRMANSVIWRGRCEIKSIREAVVRLGFRQCRNLILSSSMASLMNRIGKEERAVRETLQQHSFMTATLSTHLNRMFDLGFAGEEFTAGLIHDIGRILLVFSAPRQTLQVDATTFDESEATLNREEDLFGINHCELGAWYAAENHIPEELAEVVRYHHQPHLATKNFPLTALVSVCDHMANHWQRFGNLDDYPSDENHALKLLEAFATLDLTTTLVDYTRPILETATHEASELMAACAG